MTSTTTLHHLVDSLAEHRTLGPQIVHRAYLPAHPSRYAAPEQPLPPAIRQALAESGVERLYSHQAEGLDALHQGRHALVTTPTASGKSLVFQVPVLEEALRGGDGRALFLFPLKALGQDQRAKYDRLALACGLDESERAAIYDGDTPRAQRERIRAEPPRVLISNPDMLHHGILSHPGPWAPFLSSLRYLVLDELHTYRGIFGCHFHHVLQRLFRLCRRHGSDPQLIASSATANNAAAFAATLTGRELVAVERSGAPREGRHFVLVQPETSPYTAALQFLIAFLEAGLKTIVFTKARRITELLHSWLADKNPELARRVANYRAGFLPEERRQIERDLFEGRLDGVISTSALEMGIDVGGLDACILVGFPGSMMATWQRAGRVGREGRESITTLIALTDALDQYLLQRPDEFLERECEPLVVMPRNDTIARPHLLCAASELPLERERDAAYLERHESAFHALLQSFDLAENDATGEIHSNVKAPHRHVSLRGGGSTYTITSEVSGKAIGTIDSVRVLRECHPGAIYLHGGRQFGIVELDMERKRAIARPHRVDFFTAPLTEKITEILEVLAERSIGSLHAGLGRVKVTEWVVGFERKRIANQERLGQEGLELPPVEFETMALWFAAPRAIEETLREEAEDFMGALHATEHAAISLFPALALCDRGDLGGISVPYHPQVGSGAVFVYDGHEGGVGIAEAAFERLVELLERVAELLERCDCEDGCPACVQSPKCGNGNRPLDKAGALRCVRLLLEREPARGEITKPDLDLEAPVEPGMFSRVERKHLQPASAEAPSAPPPTAGGPSRDLFDLGAAPRAEPNEAPLVIDPARPQQPGATPPPPVRRSGGRRRPRRARSQPPPPHERAPIPSVIERTVLFDVETKRAAEEVGGWHNLHRLGVALAVTCVLEEGVFHVYREEQVPALIDELRSADLVVGFNVIGFDYPVLSGYLGEDFRRTLPTLDLFEQVREVVGKRVGLSRLGAATLGTEKSADGLQSLEWYREGRFDEIEEYCKKDVEILRDLYLFGRREGYVLHRDDEDRVVRVPVEWV